MCVCVCVCVCVLQAWAILGLWWEKEFSLYVLEHDFDISLISFFFFFFFFFKKTWQSFSHGLCHLILNIWAEGIYKKQHIVELKGGSRNQGQNNVNSLQEPAAISRANKQRRREDEEQSFAHSSCPDYSFSA